MPIVNIRDDDGSIVDSVNIPVASGGGNSGGGITAEELDEKLANYVTADAIVDRSPLDEWYNGRENYENFAACWEWRKYIDGSFYLYIYGSFGGDISEFPFEMSESLPFDVFQLDECSYYFELLDENDEAIYLDGDGLLADFYIQSAFEEEDVGGDLLVFYADITDDLREYTTEHGLNSLWVIADITITGKWREY